MGPLRCAGAGVWGCKVKGLYRAFSRGCHGSFVANARVYQFVGEIYEQVDQHIGRRHHDDYPLNNGKSPLGDGLHRQLADPLPGKDRLNDKRTPSSPPICNPSTVSVGIKAFFNPCRKMTSRCCSPLARRRAYVI